MAPVLVAWMLTFAVCSCTTHVTERAVLDLGHKQLQYNITRTFFDFVNENQIISPSVLQQKNYERVIAIGSVYGDRNELVTAMHSVGICDANGTWIASNTILIQSGDISLNAVQQIIEWSTAALEFNSLCLMIMGEYESDFLDEYYAYPVTVNSDATEKNIKQLQKLYLKFHAVGDFLRNLPIIRVIGNTVFVHHALSALVMTQVNGDIQYLNALALAHYKYRVDIEDDVELIDDCLRNEEYLLNDEFTHEDDICLMLETSMHLIGNYLGFAVRNMVISMDEYSDTVNKTVVRCENSVLFVLRSMVHEQYWEQQRIRI